MVRGRKRVSIFGHDLGEAPLDLDMTPRMGQKSGPRMRGIPQPELENGPIQTAQSGLGSKFQMLAQADARDAANVAALEGNPRAQQMARMAQARTRMMGQNNRAMLESLAGKRVQGFGEEVPGSKQLRGASVMPRQRGVQEMALMGLQQEKGFEDMDDFITRKQAGHDPNTYYRNKEAEAYRTRIKPRGR